jgi:hypothetical protein
MFQADLFITLKTSLVYCRSPSLNKTEKQPCKNCSQIQIGNRYRKARNLASKVINSAYVNHLNLVIGNLTEDPRGFYRFIKNKRTDSNGNPFLKTSAGTIPTDEGKAESLNDYFAYICTKEDTIPAILPSMHLEMPNFEITRNGVISLVCGFFNAPSTQHRSLEPGIR